MRSLVIAGGVGLLAMTGTAWADDCDDFRSIALMPAATVAAHERGADPNWLDDTSKLSDLTLLGAPCTIGVHDDGTVANVFCALQLPENVTLDSVFDATDECLRASASKISREPGKEDFIWTAGGAMVKIWSGDGKELSVKFVY